MWVSIDYRYNTLKSNIIMLDSLPFYWQFVYYAFSLYAKFSHSIELSGKSGRSIFHKAGFGLK